MKRSTPLYILFTAATIVCGLLSRSQHIPLPDLLATYAGDTLWALMVFWGFCLLMPRGKTRVIALASLLFCFGIEMSQLYHAPWIDSLRHTTPGALVLGFGFKWSDLACYSVGAFAGAFLDWGCVTAIKPKL